MAFDGVTVRALAAELRRELLLSKIDKIYQPDRDEIVLALRGAAGTHRLLLNAGAERARFHLTGAKPETPLEPPTFCMLLRKHFSSARIVDIRQSGLDRILCIETEGYNELSDLVRRRMILEIMGRHSNLILVDENGRIIDSLHHVGAEMSRFRTVWPGQRYEAPSHNHKADPLGLSEEEMLRHVAACPDLPLEKALYQIFNGISPRLAEEILYRAEVSGKKTPAGLDEAARQRLAEAFCEIFRQVAEEQYQPALYRSGEKLVEYSMLPLFSLEGGEIVREEVPSPSALVETFSAQVDNGGRMRQKSQDLRKVLSLHLERAERKKTLQLSQLEDTRDRESLRRDGDLIIANLYRIPEGASRIEVEDFYEEPPCTRVLHLDSHRTASQNAQKLYARYNKQKRTAEAVSQQLILTQSEIDDLKSQIHYLELAECEQDLEDVRRELLETGLLRHNRGKKKNLAPSRPMEKKTSEGVRVLTGKNNIQNDQLTFKTARPNDLWFHVKGIPGSHTILFVQDLAYGADYSEKSLLEAAQFAADASAAGEGVLTDVDYTLRKHVRKPAGSKPGFVTYTHQKTITVRKTAK